MPSLPRIKRQRPRAPHREAAPPPEPRLAELSAHDLTWIHLDAPTSEEATLLADRFGWHPLDIEDVLSKRQRPKIDEYADEGYLFVVLHFPVYDKTVQRLNAAELDAFIRPERSTLRLLERRVERFLPEELELYFDDIVDAAERIWDLLDNFKEVVEALEDTNESVISHRQNRILLLLTLVSVILLPLTLITGLFGMNVRFPGFETQTAFWAICGAMLAIAGGLIAFVRYKRW